MLLLLERGKKVNNPTTPSKEKEDALLSRRIFADTGHICNEQMPATRTCEIILLILPE